MQHADYVHVHVPAKTYSPRVLGLLSRVKQGSQRTPGSGLKHMYLHTPDPPSRIYRYIIFGSTYASTGDFISIYLQLSYHTGFFLNPSGAYIEV